MDHPAEDQCLASPQNKTKAFISFRMKFLLGIALILLFFSSLCSLFLYKQGRQLLVDSAYAKSQLVMASVEANQSYVREILRPKMYELLGEDGFLLEAMSTSYISRVVMEGFNRTLPEYHYRRVAIGARNPDSEANAREVEMIRRFQNYPEEREWQGIIQIGDEPLFMSYRPVYFNASCLHCHGEPGEAPGALLERYGSERGFRHKDGDIAGVSAVGIPVSIALSKVKEKALAVFIGGFLFTAVLFVAIGFFFNRVVVHDLRSLLNVFRAGLRKDEEERFFNEIDKGDEIGALKSAAGAMALYLRDSRKQLEESKELLQSVFDGITDMVLLLDKGFRIKMVNKAYLKRYGVSEQEVLDQLCHELHRGDPAPCPGCAVRKVCRSRAPEVEEVVSSGRTYLVHFYPVLDEQGEVESIVRYARDVTDQKMIEQQIQKTEKLASLGQLAAGVAHEINNPLGVILCYADLLKHQLCGASQSLSDLATIEKHALNCKRIVSDMLEFARGESSRTHFVSLNRVVEEAVQMVEHQFSKENIEIQLELDPGIPPLVMDPGKMKQVFLNLLMNSRQAMEKGGLIRIGTHYAEESAKARILFWDNGKGIPPQYLQKVFDPFFTTKAPGEGTGLGLSVSYGIVRDHRGEIQVASEPGQWTEFVILLPLDESR